VFRGDPIGSPCRRRRRCFRVWGTRAHFEARTPPSFGSSGPLDGSLRSSRRARMREVNLRNRRSVVSHVGSVGAAYCGVLSALCARARRSAVRIHTAARRRRPAARRGRRARDAAARLAASRGAAPRSGKPAALAVPGRPPPRHRRAASTPHEPPVPTFTRLRHSWYGVSRPPLMPTAGEGARRAHLHPPTA